MKYEVKKVKAILLDNATLFDIHKLSEYKGVDNCVDYLFDILSKKIDKFKRKNPSKNKSQLKTLIVNLYKNYLDDKTRFVSINLGKSYYENLESRYNKLFISSIMIDIVHALDELGFIKINKGYFSPQKSRMSRIIGTNKLFNLFTKHQFSTEMIQTSRDKELIVMRDIIDGKKNIKVDDHVIGLYSYGLHTNGFSLLRKIFKDVELNKSFVDWVKQPHRCYYDEIKLLDDITINGLVHITGGGLIDNPPRVLSDDKCMNIYKENLITQHFSYIQTQGNISDEEMYRTLNCGIGFMIVLDDENYKKAKYIFHKNKIEYCRAGYISKRTGETVNFI